MAFSVTLPHSTSDWAHLPGQLITSVRTTLVTHPSERRIARPELTQDQRAHRMTMVRTDLDRRNSALRVSGWPR